MTTAQIPSRTSAATYTVTLHDDGTTVCTCPAGAHGKPCWHVAATRQAAADATERRNAAALEILNAQINAMTWQIEHHGHLMNSRDFQTLQRRYWTARERRAELTGIPLVSVA